MLEFIETTDDVVAATISHRISSSDLSALMDRIEGCLARHGQVHVFVETRSIDGLDISGLGAHLARAMPLYRHLRRFGRVAVVADQSWVRVGTRIESALLPFVSYRTFEPARREEALAWVCGGGAEPQVPAAQATAPHHKRGT